MDLNLQIFKLRMIITVLWILIGINLTIDFTLKASDSISNGLVKTFATLSSQQLNIILLADTFIRLIPFVFAFLSLALKDSWSHLMNFVLGIAFTILSLFGLAGLLSQLTNPTWYEFVIQVVAITTPFLIAWYTYRWQKTEIKYG